MLNMFRAAYRSSSGALTVFVASDLHTHVVTCRSPLRLDYGRSPHAYVNQRLQIQIALLMMSSMPLETCWAFNERWNNEFYYKVASCWLFLLSAFHRILVNCRLRFLDMGVNYLRFPNSFLWPTVPIRVCSRIYRVKPNSAVSRRHSLCTLDIQSIYPEPKNNLWLNNVHTHDMTG